MHWQSHDFEALTMLTTWSLFCGKRDKPSSWFYGVGGVAQATRWSLHIKLMCQMCLDGPLCAGDVWKHVLLANTPHNTKSEFIFYGIKFAFVLLAMLSTKIIILQKRCIISANISLGKVCLKKMPYVVINNGILSYYVRPRRSFVFMQNKSNDCICSPRKWLRSWTLATLYVVLEVQSWDLSWCWKCDRVTRWWGV